MSCLMRGSATCAMLAVAAWWSVGAAVAEPAVGIDFAPRMGWGSHYDRRPDYRYGYGYGYGWRGPGRLYEPYADRPRYDDGDWQQLRSYRYGYRAENDAARPRWRSFAHDRHHRGYRWRGGGYSRYDAPRLYDPRGLVWRQPRWGWREL